MARNMRFMYSTALVALLYVAVAQASEEVQVKSSASPTLSYWHRKLPKTPIPDTLQNFILPFSSQKMLELLEAIRLEGNKVYVGDTDSSSAVNGFSYGFDYGQPPSAEVADDTSSATNISDHHDKYARNDDIRADPAWSALFFLEEELHSGTKLTLYRKLLKRSSPGNRIFFLPRPLAEAIPFSSDKLSVALDMLNISQTSHTARAMKQTLQVCEMPAISGETRYCPTSLESMIDYATSTLGTSNGVSVLETNVPWTLNSQQYTITGIPFRSKSGLGSVVCHRHTYPYAVYLCHQIHHTTTVRVSLKGEDGSSGEGVAVCHRDTSAWNPKHLAFKVLNLKPGGAPICHFLPAEHLLWLLAN